MLFLNPRFPLFFGEVIPIDAEFTGPSVSPSNLPWSPNVDAFSLQFWYMLVPSWLYFSVLC